jgi:hypothetical protein
LSLNNGDLGIKIDTVLTGITEAKSQLEAFINQNKGKIIDIKIDTSNLASANNQFKEQGLLLEKAALAQEKLVTAQKKSDRSLELKQSQAINATLDENYQIQQQINRLDTLAMINRDKAKVAEQGKLEVLRQEALEYTKIAQSQLNSAISKYSYGDTSQASALSSQMSLGMSNFKDLQSIPETIDQYKVKISDIVTTLKVGHEQNLSLLNQEIQQEANIASIEAKQTAELEKQKIAQQQYLNGIDLIIQKEQEEAALNSRLIQTQMQQAVNAENMAKSFQTSQNQVQQLTNKLNQIGSNQENNILFKKNPELATQFKEANTAVNALSNGLQNGTMTAEKYQTTYKATNQQINNLTSGLGIAKNNMQGFTTTMLANVKAFAQWYLIGGAISSVFRVITDGIQTVEDLNKSYVNLQIAMGGTPQQTNELIQSYIKLGQEIGATTIEVATSGDVWLRQGKSVQDANTLIKDSLVISKVGMIDSADATTYLTSAMKGNRKIPFMYRRCA